MGTSERRQREKENLRRAILDAARELFVTHGFDNVSMRKIAEKIEYSATTIYLHFKDKEEIYKALCEEGFTMLVERLEPFHIRVADPIERLRQAAHEYFAFAIEQPHYYQIMFALKAKPMMEYCSEEQFGEKYMEAGYRAFGFIIRCVHEGIALGKIPATDASEHTLFVHSHVIFASLHGITDLMLANRIVRPRSEFDKDITQEIMNATIDNTLRGLTAK